jgi:hypothetical protein
MKRAVRKQRPARKARVVLTPEHLPHEPLKEDILAEAYRDKIVQLEANLTRRLIPPFGRASRRVLNGKNAAAASRALLEVAGTLLLATLDQMPVDLRQKWIQRFHNALDTTLLSPHSMSLTQYLEGPFEGFSLDQDTIRHPPETQ